MCLLFAVFLEGMSFLALAHVFALFDIKDDRDCGSDSKSANQADRYYHRTGHGDFTLVLCVGFERMPIQLHRHKVFFKFSPDSMKFFGCYCLFYGSLAFVFDERQIGVVTVGVQLVLIKRTRSADRKKSTSGQ